MVTHDELIKLAKQSEKSFGVEQEQLIGFVKNGAVRAYKAGSPGRDSEDVLAEFNAQTKQLRLLVRKKVVAEVKDQHKECSETEGKVGVGETANIEVTDKDTYQAIDAAINGMQKLIETEWKKENALLVKTKFQEFKDKCLPAVVASSNAGIVTVKVSEIEALLPATEQVFSDDYQVGKELVVYVKEMKEEGGVCDLIVSRKDPALVLYAMRRHIPEVDTGNIDIKAVARSAGKRSRVAVFSKDFGPAERCQKRAEKVSAELGGEVVEFIEWYSETKAYIASALKAEAREVHIIESEKQALVEVFKDSAEQALDPQGEALKLAQELTGYKIEIKLCARDESTELPGV